MSAVKRNGLINTLVAALLCVGATTLCAKPGKKKYHAAKPAPASSKKNCLCLSSTGLEKALSSYLDKHPEAVYNSLMKYQRNQMEKQRDQVDKYLKQNAKEIFTSPHDGVLGNPAGATRVLIMNDYRCPHSQKALRMLEQLTQKNPRLKVVVKQMPILGPNSVIAAKAAVIGHEKHRFAQVSQGLLKDRQLNKASISKVLSGVGIASGQAESAFIDEAYEEVIKNNYRVAQKLGVQGTPVLIIANQDYSKVGFVRDFNDKESLLRLIKNQ